MDDARLKQLREEKLRCELELEQAKSDTRASHARLSAVLIRLGRAERALEDAETNPVNVERL